MSRRKACCANGWPRRSATAALALGFWSPDEGAFLDGSGRRLDLPDGAGSEVTVVRESGAPVAVLVHDAATLEDPALRESVAAAVRVAVANVRLQREIRRQADELNASRRRIVEAADLERRRLERELHDRTEARLAQLEQLLAGAAADGADPAMLAETLRRARRGADRAGRARAGNPSARPHRAGALGGARRPRTARAGGGRAGRAGRAPPARARGGRVLRLLRGARECREARRRDERGDRGRARERPPARGGERRRRGRCGRGRLGTARARGPRRGARRAASPSRASRAAARPSRPICPSASYEPMRRQGCET